MIETGRLVLRGWKEADKAPFHAMCNDPAVMEYLGAPLSHAEIDAATARQNALQAERKPGLGAGQSCRRQHLGDHQYRQRPILGPDGAARHAAARGSRFRP